MSSAEEIAQAELKQLRLIPENRTCFDCTEKGPGYVCTTLGIFVCSTCSGIHREFGHRIKGILLSTFTKEEVEQLKRTGNAAAKQVYLARWSQNDFPKPESENRDRIRRFIKLAFIEGMWKEKPVAPAPQPAYVEPIVPAQPQKQPQVDNLLISWDTPSTTAPSVVDQMQAFNPFGAQPPAPVAKPSPQPAPAQNNIASLYSQPQSLLGNQSPSQPVSQPQQSYTPPQPSSPYQAVRSVAPQQPSVSTQPVSLQHQQAQLFHQPQTINLAQPTSYSPFPAPSQQPQSPQAHVPQAVSSPQYFPQPVASAPSQTNQQPQLIQLAGGSMVPLSGYGQPMMASALPTQPQQPIVMAPGQQAPPAGQLIALPPGAMPPPGATVLIPIQTPQGIQYVQATSAPPGMVPSQTQQGGHPVAMPSSVYPGQAKAAPAKYQPIAMQGLPPGAVLASAVPGGHYGQPGQPVVIQVGPQGPNGQIPVVHPPTQGTYGIPYQVHQPQGVPVASLPGLRIPTNISYAPAPVAAPMHNPNARFGPLPPPQPGSGPVDSDFAFALQLQQQEGWPTTPDSVAADEKLARMLQDEENARAGEDDD